MLSPQWLDELRARVTLSSVIMRTTKLQRAGREWKACCPFHNENTPSFTVNDEKGFYHCFGCGAHGDAIRWMTDQRGLAFMDAVQELAAGAGLEVPRPDPRAARRAEQRAGLAEVMEAAQDWFAGNLHTSDGARARAYLSARGLDATSIERFGFGHAPDSRSALASALTRFGDALLIEAGLRIAVEGRDPYDRFRGRLMLPIHDARGRVIAFAGRILDKGATDAPKYLNSPDTSLFDKGRTLYNLHRAAPASRQAGRIIVAEGYMDVIALATAGIAEAVAPMGTALTEQQIELLWRHADQPILCFDGDAAGRRAAVRAATRSLPLLRPGQSLRFVSLPAGLDPDDLIRREGRQAMERLLEQPMSLLELLWQHERDAAPLHTPEEKAGLKARLLGHIETIADRDIAALYRRDWLDRFSAFAFPRREAAPRREFRREGPSRFGRASRPTGLSPGSAARLQAATAGIRDGLAQAVIAGLLRFPDQIARHAEGLLALRKAEPRLSPAINALLAGPMALEEHRPDPILAAKVLTPSPDSTCFSFLVEGSDPQGAREDLAEAIALLVERPALEAAIAAATARFETDPQGAFAEQQRLRKRKLEFDLRLGQMARKRAAPPAVAGDEAAADTHPSGDQTTD